MTRYDGWPLTWPQAQERWRAWWHHEPCDRALLMVRAPRAGVTPRPEAVDPITQWTDAAYMVRRAEEGLRSTWFGGEAVPLCWNPISAGHALYFGCRPHYASDTMWVDPAPEGSNGFPDLAGWRESPAWRQAQGTIRALGEAVRGRCFAMPFWGNHAVDTLAVVRGIDRFLLDVALNRAWVKETVREMTAILIAVQAELVQLVRPEITGLPGMVNSCGVWAPGSTLEVDCDVSCNVSPADFQELFLPPMLALARQAEYRLYHLDGRQAARAHLDAILAQPEIQAIQWVPGAGHEEILQWVPLIRRIQERGKSVQVYCTPAEVEPLLQRVAARGLCIVTGCASEAEARELLAIVELYS